MEKDILLGRYQILERLGSGGFAEVFKAFDTRVHRIVAIKKLPKGEKKSWRALREAQATSLLNHPNIVTLYDFVEADDANYLVMEYVEGKTLTEILNERKTLKIVEAISVSLQVLSALECAHINNVIHRDIKPENLKLLPDGRIKVMDFGIARFKNSTVTREGAVVGTFAYMSPEQAQGKYVDETTDIFSVGALLYRMLTGNSPFEAETLNATLFKLLHTTPPPPSKFNPQVSSELDRIVMKALEKNPDKRFESATEMRYKLERLLPKGVSLKKVLLPLVGEIKTYEEIPEEFRGPKVFLWRWIEKRTELVKRGVLSFVILSTFFLALKELKIFAPTFSLIISLVLGLFYFAFPSWGMLLFLLTLGVCFVVHSLALGIIFLLFSLLYWAVFARKRPHFFMFPFLAPLLNYAGMTLVYPFLVGFLFNPFAAFSLSFLGSLFVELGLLLSSPSGIFLKSASFLSLLSYFRGSGDLIKVSLSLLEPFLKYPLFLIQPFLWGLTSLLVSFLTRKRSVGKDLFAIFLGVTILSVGYINLFYLDKRFIELDVLMQGLSISLIILFVLLFLTPYGYLQRKEEIEEAEKEGKENEFT